MAVVLEIERTPHEPQSMTGSQAVKKIADGFRFAWPFPKKPSVFYNLKSCMTMTFVSALSRILFFRQPELSPRRDRPLRPVWSTFDHGFPEPALGPGSMLNSENSSMFNRMIVHNKDRFIKALEDKSRPLITIANHRSNIDDPLIWVMMTWREFLGNIWRYRYTLAAHNICFTKQFHTTLFSLGRCVPCVRGGGIHQEGMNFSKEMLDENGWIHIFPEGRVTPHPIRFKWGIGRLVMEARLPPVVVPIWSHNMNSVWPNEPPYYPRFGNTVEIHVGEPIDMSKVLERVSNITCDREKRKAITDQLQDALYGMGEKLGYLPAGTAANVRLCAQKETRAKA